MTLEIILDYREKKNMLISEVSLYTSILKSAIKFSKLFKEFYKIVSDQYINPSTPLYHFHIIKTSQK